MVEDNILPNFQITRYYIQAEEDIIGPNVCSLKGGGGVYKAQACEGWYYFYLTTNDEKK